MRLKLKPYSEYKDSGVHWLGEIPKSWQHTPLRRVTDIGLSNVDKHTVVGEEPIRLCNYTDVYRRSYITPDMRFMNASALPREIRKFELRKGDVLITKDSESWTDIAVPAYVTTDLPGVLCGYHLAQIRPHLDVLSGEYLLRVFQAESTSYQFRVAATGVTRFALSGNDISSGVIPLPPLAEQHAIMRFLKFFDRRINHLIHAKQLLIKLLYEQKQAIIHRAVTHGLDPNVRLKPSGVAWLDEIPAHWEVTRIKYLLHEVDERSITGQETLLSLRMNHGLVPHDEHFAHPGQASTLVGYKLVRPGQVVLNRLQANNGLVFKSEVIGVVSPDYAVFDPIGDVDLNYLTTLFRTSKMKHKFRVESKGLGTGTSGFLRLYSDRFSTIPVPLPPRNEQSEIMRELDTLLGGLQNTMVRVENEITVLHEYRARLIADVVTGKLDVRGIELFTVDESEELDAMPDGDELETEGLAETEEPAYADD